MSTYKREGGKMEPRSHMFPLSYAQMSMVYQQVFTTESLVNQVCFRLVFSGHIDSKLFNQALAIVSDHNEALRTIYLYESPGKTYQKVMPSRLIPLIPAKFDMVHPPYRSLLKELDISSCPMKLYFGIIEDKTILLYCWHHILMDGWSNLIFLNELFQVYQSLAARQQVALPPRSYYSDFIGYLQKKSVKRKNQAYWSEYLTNGPIASHQEEFIGNVGFVSMEYPCEEMDNAKLNVTASAIYYAAWALLLSFVEKTNYVCFGATFSGRNIPVKNIRTTIGMFINTLPICCRLSPDMYVTDFVTGIMMDILNHAEHEHISSTDIRRLMGRYDTAPLYRSIVVVENYPTGLQFPEGMEFKGYDIRECAAVSIVLGIVPIQNKLVIQYNRDEFEEADVHQLLSAYKKLIDSMIANPHVRIGYISM